MEQEIERVKEIEKLKNAPQYIDLFCNMVRQKLGDNEEILKQTIDEVAHYYKKQEGIEVYAKLINLQLEYDLMYGALNHAIEVGEEALSFFEARDSLESILMVSEKLMLAYMHKGLFKKATFYQSKAASALEDLKVSKKARTLENQESTSKAGALEDKESLFKVGVLEDKESLSQEAQVAEIMPLGGLHHQKLEIQLSLSTISYYIALKEYQQAETLLLHIEKMKTWLTPEERQESLLLRLELDLQQEQIENAVEHSKEVHILLEQGSQKYALAKGLRLRAILNGKRNLQMQAEKDFKAAFDLCTHYKEAQIRNLVSWAVYLMAQEKSDEAYEKITKAIKLAGKIDSPYFLVEAYEQLGHIYESRKQWELGYKVLTQLQSYKAQIESVQREEIVTVSLGLDPISNYEQSYEELCQIAKLGKGFMAKLDPWDLPAMIHKEIASLIEMDVMGIALYNQGKLEYNMYELSGKWLSSDNDLVRYTMRLVDYCTQFQADIVVNDGNFEEYTLKKIVNSETKMKLQSAIVFVLKVEEQVLGAMTIGSYKSKSYSQKDITVARILASYLGLMLSNKHLHQKIHHFKEHDALTGLLSRRVVLREGEKLFKENRKKHKRTAIMLLDTDSLKQINTKYGCALGDEILSKMGKLIKENIPTGHYVGRYDGEEFITILNDLSDKEVAQIAERIKKATEELTFETKKENQIKVTLSGGIYICNEYTLNFDDGLRFASHALYRAKLLGRNRIMSYSLSDIK